MRLGDVRELIRHRLQEQLLVAQDRAQGLDLALQLGLLGLELDPGELRQPAQLQVEDVGGLRVGEVEDVHQPGLGDRGVLGGADDLDDLVDVQDRDEQTLDEVQPLLALAQAVGAAAAHHVEAEVDVDPQEVLQAEGAWLAVDERDVVDAEVLLHRRHLEELLQHRLRVETALDLDDQLQAVLAVGQVLDVADALELLGLDQILDLLDDLLGSDEVGQLGDDDAQLAGGDVLDPGRRPGAKRPTPGEVRVADPLQADDLAAARKVGARARTSSGRPASTAGWP